jgi:hypothetical protein
MFRKKITSPLLLVLVLLTGPSLLCDTSNPLRTNIPDDCDCSASDGSCELSISCRGGCTRFCGSGGNCWGECSADWATIQRPRAPVVEESPFANDDLTRTFLEHTTQLQASFLLNTDTRTTCSCEKTPKRTCFGKVSCPDGCTSAAGSDDSCFLACRADVFSPRISVKFSQKTGVEIVAALSQQLHQKIKFTPNARYRAVRYDLEITDDDVWNVLRFLAKQGVVKFNGVDLQEIGELLKGRRKP